MQYSIGLDIGSHTIRAALMQTDRSGPRTLTHLIAHPSAGLRRGVVDHPTQLAQALSSPLGTLKTISRSSLKHIVLGVGGPDLKVHISKGVVAVSRADDEIHTDDIERALQSARAVTLPANRMVIDSMIKEYTVDGISGIIDPLGMIGKRLEVSVMLLESFAPSIKPLERAVQTLGGAVEMLVVSPLAAASAVISQDQRENGVMLIDIGFSKTSIAIFEEGRLSHVAVVPVGAGAVTNDLAIGLRVPIEVAETIKLSYGNALAKEVSSRDAIELNKIDPRVRGTVTKKFIAEIIEDRLAEIFELVNTEVKRVGKLSQIPAGIVLTGGGAKMASIAELARHELRLAAHVGIPALGEIASASTELTMASEDPGSATVVGLLKTESERSLPGSASPIQLTSGFKKLLNYFIP